MGREKSRSGRCSRDHAARSPLQRGNCVVQGTARLPSAMSDLDPRNICSGKPGTQPSGVLPEQTARHRTKDSVLPAVGHVILSRIQGPTEDPSTPEVPPAAGKHIQLLGFAHLAPRERLNMGGPITPGLFLVFCQVWGLGTLSRGKAREKDCLEQTEDSGFFIQ